MAANQAAVISAAKSASVAAASGGGGGLSKVAVATLVKSSGGAAAVPKGPAGSAGGAPAAAKGLGNAPVVSAAKGATVGAVVGAAKSSGGGSLVGGVGAGGGKTGAARPPVRKLSGRVRVCLESVWCCCLRRYAEDPLWRLQLPAGAPHHPGQPAQTAGERRRRLRRPADHSDASWQRLVFYIC